MDERDMDADMENREDIFDRFGRSWDKDDTFFDTMPASWRIPRVRPNLSDYQRRPMFTDMDEPWRRPSFDDSSSTNTGKERIIPIQLEGDAPEKMVVDAPCRPTHRSFAGLAAARASSCPPAPAEPPRQQPARHASGDTAAASVPASKACQQIARVAEAVKELATQVDQFRGGREQREFRYLDEMLTRQLLSLDDVDTNGEAAARAARRQVVVQIQETLSRLESAAAAASAAKNAPDNKGSEAGEVVQGSGETEQCPDSETNKETVKSTEGNDNQSNALDDKGEEMEKSIERDEQPKNNGDELGKEEKETNDNESKESERKTEDKSATDNATKTETQKLTETNKEETAPNGASQNECRDSSNTQQSLDNSAPEPSLLPDSDNSRVKECMESVGSDRSEQGKLPSSSAEDSEQQKQNT